MKRQKGEVLLFIVLLPLSFLTNLTRRGNLFGSLKDNKTSATEKKKVSEYGQGDGVFVKLEPKMSG